MADLSAFNEGFSGRGSDFLGICAGLGQHRWFAVVDTLLLQLNVWDLVSSAFNRGACVFSFPRAHVVSISPPVFNIPVQVAAHEVKNSVNFALRSNPQFKSVGQL